MDSHSEVSDLDPAPGPDRPIGPTMEGGNAPVYCICRRPDINCFMIGCDCCNEWFHGDCIGISEKAAKVIRVWYCEKCRAKDGTLEIKYRPKKTKEKTEKETGDQGKKETGDQGKKETGDQGKKETGDQGKKETGDQGKKETGDQGKKETGDQEKTETGDQEKTETGDQGKTETGDQGKKEPGDQEKTETGDQEKKEKETGDQEKKEKETGDQGKKETGDQEKTEKQHHTPDLNIEHRRGSRKEKEVRRHKQKQKYRERLKHSERGGVGGGEARGDSGGGGGGMRQCLGPGCVEVARAGSKYCSEDCGMKLATNRIYEILPQRIQQWQQSPCIAEEQGKRLLERIRRDQQSARLRLTDMEKRFHELEGIIAKAKQQVVQQDEEVNEAEGDTDTDLQIFCVSCSHPVNPKVALRHMERCYAKYESQTSFGSMYPTRIEGATRLFCDVYNPQSKTYCKRLQVLCPEHSRDPKVTVDEVCGCPLVRDVFQPTGEYCRVSKRKCNKHYCWEKLRRAEVDLERVRVWYKLDELFEQERNVRTAMTNRAGLLALMLHQTIQHDPVTTDLRTAKDR
nr:CXXC-type zinc finger protein 1-like [Oncorhynchus nerka]